jgi:hypothetical protein
MKGSVVKTLRNMEAVFVVTLGLACSASYVLDTLPGAQAQSPATTSASIAAPANMPVVVVSAKRMTAAEKQQSLEEERRLASIRNGAGSRI